MVKWIVLDSLMIVMDERVTDGRFKLVKDSKWYKACNKVYCVFFRSVFGNFDCVL